MGEEITITYETLFDLVRREKSREELQKLDTQFFDDVAAYLKDKIALVEEQKGKMFSDTEREKVIIQIQSIKKLIRELYERRERKILNLALTKARTEGALVDTSSLLEHENALFSDFNNVILKYRLSLLTTLINPQSQKKEVTVTTPSIVAESQPIVMEQPMVQQEETSPQQEQNEPTPLDAGPSIVVRFMHAVPKFVGKSLEGYGPFVEDEIAKLPKEIADILVQKGRAELFDEE